MKTEWIISEVKKGVFEIKGLPGVRVESVPVYRDSRGALNELFRVDEIPDGFSPQMACLSWSQAGLSRGPHQHREQDDYFTFAGPSDFVVALWDDRPGGAGVERGWKIYCGASNPARIYVPRGVVHGYKNIGNCDGMVVTVTNLLYAGWGKKASVDEIRHEENLHSPYKMEEL